MLKLDNQILTLKKGSMTVDEYTNAFIDKMKFALRLVHDELTKIDRYSKGLPWDYVVLVKLTPTFEATICASRFV